MGKAGIEIYKIHPKKFDKNELNEIALKSMPMGANEGDFVTVSLTNGNHFSGYVFKIPSDTIRDNIASLLAIFPSMDYKPNIIKYNFIKVIGELKKSDKLDYATLEQILPQMFDAFKKKKGSLKIVKGIEITYDFTIVNDEELTDKVKKFSTDIWG